jgi:threonine/homoserine efflux transporter RhtA
LGIFYAILSGIMVLIQGPVLRKALKKFSKEKLVIIGSVILGTNFILFVSNNIVPVGGAVILFAVGNGLMWPSFMSILSRYAYNWVYWIAPIIGAIIAVFAFRLVKSTATARAADNTELRS